MLGVPLMDGIIGVEAEPAPPSEEGVQAARMKALTRREATSFLRRFITIRL
jgi:hypothetical protein